jgi:DNA-binding PadR family transcriptional regulator
MTVKEPRPLTTTSFALLGQLATRPWSAYELNKQMQHSNLRYLWPRTASRVYQEVKNLAAHELVTATPDQRNGRRRTVYTITDEGCTALVDWLSEPAGGLVLQHETLLKLIYTNFAGTAELRAHLAGVAEDARAQAQFLAEIYLQTREHGPLFPERAHLNAIAYEWLTRVLEATIAWADWASNVVDDWPTATMDNQQGRWARSTYDQAATRLTALSHRDDTPS